MTAPSGGPGAWVAAWAPAGSAGGEPRFRFRILETSGASVPDVAEEAALVAILDGVLHNRVELRALLGCDAASSDARLVLRAWRRWGDDALGWMKGLFALAVANRETGALLAARDPLGIYPLFYADTRGALLLSTSIESLIRQPAVSRAVNRPALAGLLCHHWPDAEETFFGEVRRLPAGHAMAVRPGGRRLFRHWDPAPPDRPMRWIGDDELDQFGGLFQQAVRRCADLGSTGLFLSGGLDSVSVAAVAADDAAARGLPPPLALSMTFLGEPDEQRIQEDVAARLELPQVLLPFRDAAGPEGIVLSALEMSAQWPWPLLNPWRPAYRQLGLAGRARGCEVILTGEGGDEWLALSSQYAADLLRRLDFAGLWHLGTLTCRSYKASPYGALRMLLRHGVRTLAMAGARTVLERTAPSAIRARRRLQRRRSIPAWVAADPELRREMDRRAEHEVDEARQQPKPKGFYLRNVRGIFSAVSRSMELEESFELGRHMGVRLLQPFWDADLVSFLYRTPPEFLVWNGRTKGPIRRMLAERLPGLGFEAQRKVTIGTVWRDMMAAEVPHAWAKMGGLVALPALGLVDMAALGRAMADRSWNDFRLTSALNVEAWLRPRL